MCLHAGTFLASKTQQISQQGALQRVKGVEPKWDTAPGKLVGMVAWEALRFTTSEEDFRVSPPPWRQV